MLFETLYLQQGPCMFYLAYNKENLCTGNQFANLGLISFVLSQVPVRLNGSNIDYGGRVEVFYKGKWGKICPNGWNFEDVKVICRQLGFKQAVAEFVSEVKDEDIPFVMSDVACMGDEPDLASCPRTDGKLNIDCQNDGTGAQALCEPKRK